MPHKIVIGVATYNRNESLANLLTHARNLITPDGCVINVVIADNNPDKKAFKIYSEFKENPGFELLYVHEPMPNIAAVRNSVLQKAVELKADYVAFIDDDEYPEPEWISELYRTMIEYKADGATSSPIQIVDGKKVQWSKHVALRKNGSVRKICITNSVLFKIDVVTKSNIWFDTDFGLMTGEDVNFFSRATASGYKFVWCNKVLLYETLTSDRLTLEWQIDRAINNGYLKIFNHKKSGKNTTIKYYKTLFDLNIFSMATILSFCLSKSVQRKCLMKLRDCFGKIKCIFSNKSYTHYKRTS